MASVDAPAVFFAHFLPPGCPEFLLTHQTAKVFKTL
jgi:hypothetical protein